MSWPSTFHPGVVAPCQEPLIGSYFVAPFELYLAEPDDDFQSRNPVGHRQVVQRFAYNLLADNGIDGLFWAELPSHLVDPIEDLKLLGVAHLNCLFENLPAELARKGLAADLRPGFRPKGDV